LVRQIRPGLIQHDERRRAIEALLDPAEQVKQHRQHGLVIELEKVLSLKCQHPSVSQTIAVRIEQEAHGSTQREVLESCPDVFILDGGTELGYGPGRRSLKPARRLGNGVPVFWTSAQAIQLAKRFEPSDGPGQVGIAVYFA